MGSETLEKPLVLVLRSPAIPPTFFSKSLLQAHFHLLEPLQSSEPTHSYLTSKAHSVLAVLCVGATPVSSETLSLLPSLKLVVASSAGLDHIDLQECRRRGITVTTAGQVFSENVADFAVGLLIDVLRRITASDRYVRSGLWLTKGTNPLGLKLRGKRVGIVGLGRIGLEVAKRLVPFGCIIAYCSRKEKPSVPYSYYSSVNELAKTSDALIICCSLTKETHHIINNGVLEALGKEGVIINVGRGRLIDEKELVKFLVEGRLRGAGLDVFEDEPHVPRELMKMENVVMAPHAAVFTPEAFAAMHDLVIGNLNAFFSNKRLLSPAQLD